MQQEIEKPQSYPLESVIIGKRHGRDIRVTVPAGQALIYDHPQTRDAHFSLLVQRIENGSQRFDNYPHDVFVLDSSILNCARDAVGTEVCYVEIFGLGDHTINNVGTKIAREKAWNGREDETRLFARYTTHRWNPGSYSLNLITNSTGEHGQVSQAAEKWKQSKESKKIVQDIYDRAARFNTNAAPPEVHEDVERLTGT